MPLRPIKQYNLILAITLLLLTTRIGLGSQFSSASDITIGNLYNAVNKERSQRNIPNLITNYKLAAAAAYKSQDMITRKYFSHTDPEGRYIWNKIVAEGYTPYTTLGENLAIDFSNTEGLVAAWIDSPTHRANLLNQNFKDQGMGVAFGNTNNGEYSVAVTNTFGAQPVIKPVASTPPPTTVKPAPKRAALNPKRTVRKPTTKGAEQLPSITLTIDNSEDLVHKNLFTLFGTSSAKTPLTLKDSTIKDSQPVVVRPDEAGNFSYTFTNLSNGIHNFIAEVEGISTNFLVEIDYHPPQIDKQKLTLTTEVKNNQLVIAVSVPVSNQPHLVTMAVAGKNIALSEQNGNYFGSISLDKYTSYKDESVVITASDIYENQDSTSVALKNFPLKDSGSSKGFGNFFQNTGSPDLYNTFKYVVLIFGSLFVIFILGDALHLTKKKKQDNDFTRGSNIIVLLLMMSTMLLVNWWH